ncbi:hypothetical protein [Kutzneria sp. NPDC052558]|uniref:hypothetical protein n=1 Tax=Kutzneria sp. NPDC052558 TaxID=3364121 RepID=UPI0037C98628
MQTVVESVEATLVLVPMRRTLGTSVASVANAPLLLIDLRTSDRRRPCDPARPARQWPGLGC